MVALPLRYGTCVIFTPVSELNHSPARCCVEPTPTDE